MESNSSRRKYSDLDSLPPGYRFCPLASELLVFYLRKKVKNEPLPPNRIVEINLYEYSPEQLDEMYKPPKEKEMFFFTQRDRKHQNGSRPNRVTGFGYWKATGADKQVKFNDEVVGFKKTLVFYKRTSMGHEKTKWIMHELRVDDQPPSKKHVTDMKLDWVLCRIYHRVSQSKRAEQLKEDDNTIRGNNHDDYDEDMRMDSDNNVNSTKYANPSRNAFADTSAEMMEPICIMPPQGQSSTQISYSNANNSYFDYMHQPQQNSFSLYTNTDQNAYIESVQPLNFDCEASSEMAEPNCIMPTQAHSGIDSFNSNANAYFDSMHESLQNNFPETLQPNHSMAAMDTELPASNANHGTSAEMMEPLNFKPPSIQSSINPYKSSYLRKENLWASMPTALEDDIWGPTYYYDFSG